MKIFMSYRRADSIGIAGRIRDRLAQRSGSEIFFDVDTIPLGVDFREHIDQSIDDCDVLLVVIGRGWLGAADDTGRRRLDRSDDFVRYEVEAALRREIPVIPLCVDGASMPSKTDLPKSIEALAFRNGLHVRHDPDFHSDVDRLIAGLRFHDEADRPSMLTTLPSLVFNGPVTRLRPELVAAAPNPQIIEEQLAPLLGSTINDVASRLRTDVGEQFILQATSGRWIG